jgi:hypothetical protein
MMEGAELPTNYKNNEELRISHVTWVNTSRKYRQEGDERGKGEMHT